MAQKPERDIEKDYPLPEFIDKLRRLADALETGQRFEIQIAGERISVPVRATFGPAIASLSARSAAPRLWTCSRR